MGADCCTSRKKEKEKSEAEADKPTIQRRDQQDSLDFTSSLPTERAEQSSRREDNPREILPIISQVQVEESNSSHQQQYASEQRIRIEEIPVEIPQMQEAPKRLFMSVPMKMRTEELTYTDRKLQGGNEETTPSQSLEQNIKSRKKPGKLNPIFLQMLAHKIAPKPAEIKSIFEEPSQSEDLHSRLLERPAPMKKSQTLRQQYLEF